MVTDGDAPFDFSWDFGESGIAQIREITPGETVFEKPGVYIVTFTATERDNPADTDSATVRVTVNKVVVNTRPVAGIISPVSDVVADTGDSVSFEGMVTDGDAPFDFSWDFGDSGVVQTDEISPGEVIFDRPGVYIVTFTVTERDNPEDADSATVRVTVNEKIPEDTEPAAFIVLPSSDITADAGSSVNFQGSVTNGDAPLTFLWNFDGSTSDSGREDPGDMVFDAPGIYTVTFTVTDKDGDSSEASVTIKVIRKPDLYLPGDGQTDVPFTFGESGEKPELGVNTFSDPNYVHAETRWQIAASSDFSPPVFDITTASHLTSVTVPESVLKPETEYHWRVRFSDDRGGVTEWSDAHRFTTARDADDSNSDGVPDRQEADITTDLDNNGIPDKNQNDIKSVSTAFENGQTGIRIPADAAAPESLRSVSSDEISDTDSRPEDMPLGMVSFRMRTRSPGDTAGVTVYFSETLPDDAVWHTYSTVNGWQDYSDHAVFSADRKSVMLELTDGGFGDADGAANSVIVNTSGYGIPRRILSPTPPSDDVGGTGCFIGTVSEVR